MNQVWDITSDHAFLRWSERCSRLSEDQYVRGVWSRMRCIFLFQHSQDSIDIHATGMDLGNFLLSKPRRNKELHTLSLYDDHQHDPWQVKRTKGFHCRQLKIFHLRLIDNEIEYIQWLEIYSFKRNLKKGNERKLTAFPSIYFSLLFFYLSILYDILFSMLVS